MMNTPMSDNRTRQIMRQIAALFVTLLLSLTNAYAGDDFGMWGTVNAEKELNSRWSLGAEVEYRSRDNLKSADRWSFGVESSYQIARWLKATVGYSLLDDHHHNEYTSGTKYTDYWAQSVGVSSLSRCANAGNTLIVRRRLSSFMKQALTLTLARKSMTERVKTCGAIVCR